MGLTLYPTHAFPLSSLLGVCEREIGEGGEEMRRLGRGAEAEDERARNINRTNGAVVKVVIFKVTRAGSRLFAGVCVCVCVGEIHPPSCLRVLIPKFYRNICNQLAFCLLCQDFWIIILKGSQLFAGECGGVTLSPVIFISCQVVTFYLQTVSSCRILSPVFIVHYLSFRRVVSSLEECVCVCGGG